VIGVVGQALPLSSLLSFLQPRFASNLPSRTRVRRLATRVTFHVPTWSREKPAPHALKQKAPATRREPVEFGVKPFSLVQPHHVTEQSLLIQGQHILGLEEIRHSIVDLLGG